VIRLAAFVVLALTIAIVPQAMAAPTKADATALPVRGILHPGRSLAGIQLGDTMARVKQLWGHNYKVCQGRQCPYPTWYYIYPKGEPLGASVRFKNGKVVTIFTLGSPIGWRTAEGLIIGSRSIAARSSTASSRRTSASATAPSDVRTNSAVTAIYTTASRSTVRADPPDRARLQLSG
jgi:hypothetical protein